MRFKNKKLQLSRETLRQLQGADLPQVAGGTTIGGTGFSCPTSDTSKVICRGCCPTPSTDNQ